MFEKDICWNFVAFGLKILGLNIYPLKKTD